MIFFFSEVAALLLLAACTFPFHLKFEAISCPCLFSPLFVKYCVCPLSSRPFARFLDDYVFSVSNCSSIFLLLPFFFLSLPVNGERHPSLGDLLNQGRVSLASNGTGLFSFCSPDWFLPFFFQCHGALSPPANGVFLSLPPPLSARSTSSDFLFPRDVFPLAVKLIPRHVLFYHPLPFSPVLRPTLAFDLQSAHASFLTRPAHATFPTIWTAPQALGCCLYQEALQPFPRRTPFVLHAAFERYRLTLFPEAASPPFSR